MSMNQSVVGCATLTASNVNTTNSTITNLTTQAITTGSVAATGAVTGASVAATGAVTGSTLTLSSQSQYNLYCPTLTTSITIASGVVTPVNEAFWQNTTGVITTRGTLPPTRSSGNFTINETGTYFISLDAYFASAVGASDRLVQLKVNGTVVKTYFGYTPGNTATITNFITMINLAATDVLQFELLATVGCVVGCYQRFVINKIS